MLVASLGFAIMGALVKVGAAKFTSAELVFYRSLFGLIAIYAFILAKRLPLRTPVMFKHMSRSLVGFGSLVLFFYAIAHLPLATAITLNYTSPLFLAAFLPFFFREKAKKLLYVTIGIGFIGVLMLLQPTFSKNDALAGTLGLASGIGASFAYIFVKQLGNLEEPDWRTVFYFTLVSTIGAGIWMMLNHFTPISWQDLPVLTGLGVSATIAQLAMTRAYRTGKPLIVAGLSYTTVLLASLFGVIFWHEDMTMTEWLGISLIILSGVFSIKTTNKAK